MKLHKLRQEQAPQLMIIPMIDIMFFLLVFFMMSTLYMVEQRTIPVQLPQATAARQDTLPALNLTVLADGRIYLEQDEIAAGQLGKRLQGELAARPDRAFVLRADKAASYDAVITALDALKTAGAQRIALAGAAAGR